MFILFLPSIRLSYFNGPLKVYAGDEAVPHTEAQSESSDEDDVNAEKARFQEVLKGVKIAFRAGTAPLPQPYGQLETVAFEGPVQMVLGEDAGIEQAAQSVVQPHGQLETVAFEAPVEMVRGKDAGIEQAKQWDIGEEHDAVEDELFKLIAEEFDLTSLDDRDFFGADD